MAVRDRRNIIKIIVILALLGILSGFLMVYYTRQKIHPAPIAFQPPKPPFEHFIAAQGIVESYKEDLTIGTPFGELVEEVYVDAGDKIKKGDPLFRLVDETLQKELEVAKKNYELALATYEKQIALPRAEDVPPFEAIKEQRKMGYEDALTRFKLYESIRNPHSISVDDFNTKKFAAQIAKYQLEEADANLALLLAGAWEKDLAIYKADVASKKASMEVIEKNLERYTMRSPTDGYVLHTNITKGEYALPGATVSLAPLMILGYIDTLQVRVTVDEESVWRVLENAAGYAYVRGNSNISTPIEFMRIEPYLVPKSDLTGNAREVVDTRVLQIMYKFQRNDLPVYPGEVLDIYIEAKPNIEFKS